MTETPATRSQQTFPNCQVVHDGGWIVVSPFWRIRAADEASARRTVEIIRAAYEAGRGEIAAALRDLINEGCNR